MKKSLLMLFALFGCTFFAVSQTARLQIFHGAADPAVNVYVNNMVLLTNVDYLSATSFNDVPGGVPLNLVIETVATNDTLANQNVTFIPTRVYTLAAGGVVGHPVNDFVVHTHQTAREVSTNANNVQVTFYCGSISGLALPHGVRVVGSDGSNIHNGVPYGTFSAYTDHPADLFEFELVNYVTSTNFGNYAVDFSALAGEAVTIFTTGAFSDDPDFQVGMIRANGEVTILDPIVPAPEATFQLIHNSPGTDVDVYFDGVLAADDVTFNQQTPALVLPADRTLSIAFAPSTSTSVDDAIATFDVPLEGDRNYLAIANGIVGNADTPFNLEVTDARRFSHTAMDIEISVFHGSPGAPAVDVFTSAGVEVATNLSFGEFSTYANIPAAPASFEVRLAGTTDIVARFGTPNFSTSGGNSFTLLLDGIIGSTPRFGAKIPFPSGNQLRLNSIARVQIVHNSPNPPVDIYIDSVLAFDNVGYLAASAFFNELGGLQYEWAIAPATSTSHEDALARFDLNFADGSTQVVMAAGELGNPDRPFTLEVFDQVREVSPDPDRSFIVPYHGSIDAPTVDFYERDTEALVIDNLEYGDETRPGILLDPTLYYLNLVPEGASNPEDKVTTYEVNLTGYEGGTGLVFAAGFLDGIEPLELYILIPAGLVRLLSVTEVQMIHTGDALGLVDVYLNNVLLADDLNFREATPFLSLPVDTFSLSFAPATSTSVDDAFAVFEEVDWVNNENSVLFLSGEAGTSASFVRDQNARTKSTGGVDLAAYHGSPDAPAVDVTNSADDSALFSDLSFEFFADYINLPAASYVINVTPAGDPATVVRSYTADLNGLDGGAAIAFATGFLTDGSTPEFELWVALPDGTTFPLPIAVNVGELAGLDAITVAPNPTADVANIEFSTTQALDVDINVIDLQGRKALNTESLSISQGTQNHTIDVSTLPVGSYFIQVVNQDGVATQRLQVVR